MRYGKYGELERIKNAHLESRLDDEKTIERIKKIVHMYLVEGKNLDEIAKILEVSYDNDKKEYIEDNLFENIHKIHNKSYSSIS